MFTGFTAILSSTNCQRRDFILVFLTLYVNILFFFYYTYLEVNILKYYERIREIREDNSFTQQQIADVLHIGQRTYSDYETGKTRIPVESLLILARFYDTSVDYISGASDTRNKYPQK